MEQTDKNKCSKYANGKHRYERFRIHQYLFSKKLLVEYVCLCGAKKNVKYKDMDDVVYYIN